MPVLNATAPSSSPGWHIWVDRGGTFTDILALDPTGQLHVRKLLSELPGPHEDAILRGIRQLLGLDAGAPVPAGAIRELRVGTTVATNALLERRGVPTVLVITRGFADLPVIGSQERPELFALDIQRPPVLHHRVVEADERLAADGSPLRPLDETSLEQALAQARAEGCEACAIALLHGWRHPRHEEQAAQVARRAGFTQISLSHRVDPQQRLLPRADTTVADAYLSPVLQRYLDRLAQQLPGVPLKLMQSSGVLCDARAMSGKDAVLSGPAGGVVSVMELGRLHGCAAVIGFDMGGTSTDVCHCAGPVERSSGQRVAGVRLRTPMLQIHTVAAGGGSVVTVDGARLTVGPASAGALPGPACYGRGGPATVTDANLLLGCLYRPRFPTVFGASGDQPLDANAAQAAFEALANTLRRASGGDWTAVGLAEGARRIANEAMARAIRQISVQRGHDVRNYALCAFGGAGGQHACAVAELLGMRRVLLHPLASLQSAWGIGLAGVGQLRRLAVDQPLLQPGLAAALNGPLRAALAELRSALDAQTGPGHTPTTSTTALLRYAGSDSCLELPWPDTADDAALASLAAPFHQLHRGRYGFSRPDTPVLLDALRVELSSAAPRPGPLPKVEPNAAAPAPLDWSERLLRGERLRVPVHERAGLRPGCQLDGPALIVDDTSTLVLDPGWALRCAADGSLDLRLREGAPQRLAQNAGATAAPMPDPAPDPAPDPVTLELFHRLFMAIAERMGVTLAQTSQSVNIRERLDFSCALFDAQGQLLANAPHMPVHLGSMGDSVAAVRRRHGDTVRSGESYALNAPFDGGTHLPDITVVSPVFLTDTLGNSHPAPAFWVASRGHHADIGGITPGSMPPRSTRIDEEGVLFDGCRIVADGQLLDDELRARLAAGPWPARKPEQNLADLRAQVAANQCGADAVREACARHGVAQVAAYARYVLDDAEDAVRRALQRIHDGAFTVDMDNGARIAVQIRVDRVRRSASIDFSGSSAQRADNFNAPTPVAKAAVLYVFRTLIDRDIPLNEGCLRPLQLLIPSGSLLAPQYPAAVVAGNVETSQCIVDALFGALGVLAAAQGTMNNLSFGNAHLQYYETICGGAGAGPGFAGCDAVHTHMTNSRLTDPEVLETRYPVRVERFAIRRGSGGPGRWPGGDGVIRELRFLQPMTVALLANRRRTRPFGLAGGGDALPGHDHIRRRDGQLDALPDSGEFQLAAGEGLIIETPGGGGYGKL